MQGAELMAGLELSKGVFALVLVLTIRATHLSPRGLDRTTLGDRRLESAFLMWALCALLAVLERLDSSTGGISPSRFLGVHITLSALNNAFLLSGAGALLAGRRPRHLASLVAPFRLALVYAVVDFSACCLIYIAAPLIAPASFQEGAAEPWNGMPLWFIAPNVISSVLAGASLVVAVSRVAVRERSFQLATLALMVEQVVWIPFQGSIWLLVADLVIKIWFGVSLVRFRWSTLAEAARAGLSLASTAATGADLVTAANAAGRRVPGLGFSGPAVTFSATPSDLADMREREDTGRDRQARRRATVRPASVKGRREHTPTIVGRSLEALGAGTAGEPVSGSAAGAEVVRVRHLYVAKIGPNVIARAEALADLLALDAVKARSGVVVTRELEGEQPESARPEYQMGAL